MSASFALVEQASELDRLLKLASLNVSEIKANGEEIRKQLQLTQAKEGEVAEAKAYIAKHASLAADLQRREDELAEGKKSHAEEVGRHAEFVASENIRLEKFAAELNAKDKEHSVTIQRLANQEGENKAAIAEHERQNNAVITSNANITRANAAAKLANETEAERLKEWEANLKGKAQRLREQAANF